MFVEAISHSPCFNKTATRQWTSKCGLIESKAYYSMCNPLLSILFNILKMGYIEFDDSYCANVQPLGSRGRSPIVNLSCHGNRQANNGCMDGIGRRF